MIPARSDLLDVNEVDETSHRRSSPTLVSLHFIRSSLRRRWIVCVLFAVAGLLAATAFLVASSQSHTAQTTLVLSRDPDADASRAGSTDVSLLTTRTVAAKTIASLGLTMTPDGFLKSVKVEPVSSELISVTISAPSDAEAIRRLTALSTIYLAFRSEQLTLQSNLLVNGMQQRIGELQGSVTALSQRIEQLAGANGSSDSTLSDMIEQRAYIQGQIDTLRQSVEDAKLKNAAVVASSRVIDAPATDAGGMVRRIVLTLASGLIGGAALGCGIVLFFAITSDRLRRRSDVAAALEVPVPVSVGRVAPLGQRWRSLPYLRTLDHRRTVERHRLAHAIEMELPSPRQWGPLGVVCIDNADEVRFAVAIAAANLAAEGCSVAVIDLTKQGNVELGTASAVGSAHKPTLLRPRGIPMLADGMAHLRVVGEDDGTAPSLDHTDVTLVVADLDPSIGADYLLTWTDRVLVAVTAGHSSAEMVRTAADLVRTAGLELRLAALLHTERTDDSSGTAGFDRPIPVPIHLVDVQERPEAVGRSVEEKQAINEDQAAAHEEQTDEERPAEEQTSDEEQAAAFEEPSATDQAHDQQALERSAAVDLEQTAIEEQASADQEQVVVEDGTPDQQLHDGEQSAEEQSAAEQTADEEQAAAVEEQASNEQPVEEQGTDELIDEEQTPDREQTVNEEQAAVVEEQSAEEQAKDEPPAEMRAAADLEQTAIEEQASADQEQVAIEDGPPDQEQPTDEEQIPEEEVAVLEERLTDEGPTTNDEQAAALEEQSTDEVPRIDGELPAQVQGIVERDKLGAEDLAVDVLTADDDEADETELVANPALLASPPDQTKSGRIWQLFLIEKPLVQIEPSPGEDELDWSFDWIEEPDSKQESAVIDADHELPLGAESGQVVYPSPEERAVGGWALYIDEYSPAEEGSALSSEDDELSWDWDWDLSSDDSDFKQESAVGLDNKVERPSDEHSLTTSENGSENGQASELRAEAETREAAERPVDNGQVSNGQRHPRTKTRTRTRRKRSRLK